MWVVVGELSARNFGLLIAYVLPGFVALWGLSYTSDTVHAWLVGAGSAGPSVSGFFYVLLGSVACGMTASAIRWAVIDRAHHATGLRPPRLDFSTLQEHLDAFERVIEYHYQYYKFYSNTLVALLFAYPLWRATGSGGSLLTDGAFLSIEVVFAAGSRNALRHYYRRAAQLLGESETPNDQRRRRRKTRHSEPEEGEHAATGKALGSETGDDGGRKPA